EEPKADAFSDNFGHNHNDQCYRQGDPHPGENHWSCSRHQHFPENLALSRPHALSSPHQWAFDAANSSEGVNSDRVEALQKDQRNFRSAPQSKNIEKDRIQRDLWNRVAKGKKGFDKLSYETLAGH